MALVDPSLFTWTTGEQLLTRFESNSGAGLLFCSRCGSTLCTSQQGQVHGITLGCIDGDPGIRLNRHIYVGSKAAWETIPDDVPHYQQGVPTTDADQN